MIEIRLFRDTDAEKTAEMIATTLKISNSRDYSEKFIEENIKSHDADVLIQKAKKGHFFVACDKEKIVGCGGITGYWGSLTESFIMTFFVLPDYQKQGIGKKIMQTLENDEIFKRAERIEIAASITACDFYKKMGYTLKDATRGVDEYGTIRLEKFK
jgi:GNAT superfamily N-acetyltransferase